jgi:prepilin peptidase CpaA
MMTGAALAASAILLAAAGCDLARLRIPNLLPAALAVLALGKLLILGWPAWPGHLGAGALMLALATLAFAAGWCGGGDAKLVAAAAFWLGLAALPAFLLAMAGLGALLALVLLALRPLLARFGQAAAALPAWCRPGAPIPYGLPITLAALLVEWGVLAPAG